MQGDTVVVGDLEGWVHWLAISDGKFVARARLSKNPIQAAPVVVGDMVYVEDIDGEIGAYRVGKYQRCRGKRAQRRGSPRDSEMRRASRSRQRDR